MLLPVCPEKLDGVELGGIAREPLDLDRTCSGIDVIAHQPAAMCGQPVPDHEQFALDLAAQLLQEVDDPWAIERARDELEIEVPERQSRDRRQLMPIEVHLQHRGLTARGPSADSVRALRQTGFVDETLWSALGPQRFF